MPNVAAASISDDTTTTNEIDRVQLDVEALRKDAIRSVERAMVLLQTARTEDENDADPKATMRKLAKRLRWAHFCLARLEGGICALSTAAIAHGRGHQ